MFFPAPPVELWTDPGPFPYSRLRRWLVSPRVEPPAAWIEQRQAHYHRLAAETEEIERQEAAAADLAYQHEQYQIEGAHLAEVLPYYLHHLKLSHRRTVQDRKSERYYEKIDYCQIREWYFDAKAFYFWISTSPLPWGLSLDMFKDQEIAATLSVNMMAEVAIEVNHRDHPERPGLWVVVHHHTGKGVMPKMVPYADILKAIPKDAPPLTFPVGMVAGKYLFADMDDLVSVLVVGSRGAGKSNTLNVMLNTWINRANPQLLRLFLTDLKGGLEFFDYQGIPHLGGDVDIKMRLNEDDGPQPVRLGQEIMVDPFQVIPVLRYIEAEMERRFVIMKGKAKKIGAYNRKFKSKLSYWVLVVDELATLMDSEYKSEAEHRMGEIARKGRAVGIYTVFATQIPDKTVLTRQIAGNMECRIVGRLADGPSSALSLGDGTWDAATILPKDVPGRMIWRFDDKKVVQSPLIPDLTIKQSVHRLQRGEIFSPAQAAEDAMAMEIFKYAHEYLGGLCARRDLYNHFKARFSEYSIRDILKKWEVSGSENPTPIIKIDDEQYVLAPACKEKNVNGRTSKRLVTLETWHSMGYGVTGEQDSQQVHTDDLKPDSVEEPEQAFEVLEPQPDLDYFPISAIPDSDEEDEPAIDQVWEAPERFNGNGRPKRKNGKRRAEELLPAPQEAEMPW